MTLANVNLEVFIACPPRQATVTDGLC